MRKFEKTIKVGTAVKVEGLSDLNFVSEISSDRKLIKLSGFQGSFQRSHVTKYTNKITKVKTK